MLQKKKVIFLHWFHHCTVLLYCWHAYHNRIAPGIWFAAMNYSVHSVMYAYYFAASVGMRAVVRPVAPLITAVQIVQVPRRGGLGVGRGRGSFLAHPAAAVRRGVARSRRAVADADEGDAVSASNRRDAH